MVRSGSKETALSRNILPEDFLTGRTSMPIYSTNRLFGIKRPSLKVSVYSEVVKGPPLVKKVAYDYGVRDRIRRAVSVKPLTMRESHFFEHWCRSSWKSSIQDTWKRHSHVQILNGYLVCQIWLRRRRSIFKIALMPSSSKVTFRDTYNSMMRE